MSRTHNLAGSSTFDPWVQFDTLQVYTAFLREYAVTYNRSAKFSTNSSQYGQNHPAVTNS
jgi:hypothetical protein